MEENLEMNVRKSIHRESMRLKRWGGVQDKEPVPVLQTGVHARNTSDRCTRMRGSSAERLSRFRRSHT